MRSVGKHINEIKKCRDVSSITSLHHPRILVSNSLKQFILPVIKHLKLKRDFREIYGAEDFTDKADFLKEYIIKHSLNKRNCYYIGDRAADAVLAKNVGCKSIIIAGKCAWDSKKEIANSHPDFIVHSLHDLKKIV